MARSKPALVYLDHSHLCDAFHGSMGSGDSVAQGLASWIDSLTGRAVLVFSTIHLLELREWQTEKRDVLADWLETKPIVWADPSEETRQPEVAEALACIMDPIRRPSFAPFYPTAADLYDQSNPGAADEIRGKPLREVLGYIVKSKEMTETVELMRKTALEHARNLRADRIRAAREETRQRTDAILDEQVVAARRRECANVAGFHWFLSNPRYWPAGPSGFRRRPSLDRVLRAVGIAPHFPTLFPSWSVGTAFWRGNSWAVADSPSEPGTKGFTKRHQGDFPDFIHARVGGAYADIFTCDKRTLGHVETARVALGRPPPICRSLTMVDELEAQLQAVLPRRR